MSGEFTDRPSMNNGFAVRGALPGDADSVASIVYESAPEIYDRLMGGRQRAVSLLTAAFRRAGTDTSAEVTTVAEWDGEVAAVLSAFPVQEAGRRASGLIGLMLARTAPWRWPVVLNFIRRSRKTAPPPPTDALYIDALATAPRLRRRGAARALLRAAEQRARRLDLSLIALDTEQSNLVARSLYESEGYVVSATGPKLRGMPRFVLYVKDLTRREP
jgi:ribosomal protein S18 acetylase RimI-like enzyme